MSSYRVYFVGADGHFCGAENLDCRNDEEALEKAAQYADGFDVELWQGSRRIARLTAKERA